MSDEVNNNTFTYSEDLANAEAPNPLPKGIYPAEVRKSTIEDSKSTEGNRNLVLDCFIAPEMYPPDYMDGNLDGMTLKSWKPLRDTPRGRYGQKKFNEALGVKNTKECDANAYMGVTCKVEIDWDINPQDGLPREVVRRILAN